MGKKKSNTGSDSQQQQQNQQPSSAQGQQGRIAGFIPPGASAPGAASGDHSSTFLHRSGPPRRDEFGFNFERQFHVPRRIMRCPTSLIEAVNDFHYAMMNDLPRNEFYYEALRRKIVPGQTGVIEIGAGSGLLSMMAAKLGAKWVVAVEGSAEMAALARENIAANDLEDKVRVYNLLSTDLKASQLPGTPDLMVSEIFGTLLLGESALDYIADMRRRLLPQNCPIVPRYGTQFAVLIECPTIDSICSVDTWNGIKLGRVNALKDTASCVFTKKYGFRMSSVPYTELCEPIPVVPIDFMTHDSKCIPRKKDFSVKITKSGTAHAVLLYWKAMDEDLVMSTDPKDTIQNFPRDMQWGQALQLLDAELEDTAPTAVVVKEGDTRIVSCISSEDGVVLQFGVPPVPTPAS